MTAQKLRNLIQTYLDLIDHGAGSPAENEQALVRVLDRLALSVHDAPAGGVTQDVDAPEIDEDAVRALALRRFPDFGDYGSARLLEDEPERMLVGDAIDDVVDIYKDLREVAWTFDEVDEREALWDFHFGFRSHWGVHLRELQVYLHMRHAFGAE